MWFSPAIPFFRKRNHKQINVVGLGHSGISSITALFICLANMIYKSTNVLLGLPLAGNFVLPSLLQLTHTLSPFLSRQLEILASLIWHRRHG
jgi:hypothetical protein